MKRTLPFALAAFLAATACTTTTTSPANQGSVYGTSSSQRAAAVQYGVIASVRTVELRDDGAQVAGAIVGGLVGGILGNQFGQGSGNTVMTAAGAAGGAIAGSQIASNNGGQLAQEWTVRLDNGRGIAVIQNGNFHIGQPIQVILGADGRARLAAR